MIAYDRITCLPFNIAKKKKKKCSVAKLILRMSINLLSIKDNTLTWTDVGIVYPTQPMRSTKQLPKVKKKEYTLKF